GTSEQRARGRSDEMAVAMAGQRRRVRVGETEGGYGTPAAAQHRFDGLPQAGAETDGHQEVLAAEQSDLVEQVPRRADGRLGVEAQRQQPVRQEPGQRGGQVDADDQDPAGPVYPAGDV